MAGYIGSKAAVVSSGAERKKLFNITTTTTSLTGLAYTLGQVHVFHNGVRLVDVTDYTATNGTSITLTVAAENGDQVAVVSYATFQTSDTVSASAGGTFAGDVTMTGAFTSLGIDDNATSTAITLDASGNVLVGGTDTVPDYSSTDTGHAFRADGRAGISRDGGPALSINRLTSDGDILQFRKDGTMVGSIGTDYGDIYIGSGHVGLSFNDSGSEILPYSSTDGAWKDGHTDIGTSSYRFKDLYLSGGVYLGGTGAANYLSEYEEGVWTPDPQDSSGNSGSAGAVAGNYTKIGNVVHATVYLSAINTSGLTGGNDFRIYGLPFSAKALAEAQFFTGAARMNDVTFSGNPNLAILDSSDFIRIAESNSGTASDFVVVSQVASGTGDIYGSITYMTN